MAALAASPAFASTGAGTAVQGAARADANNADKQAEPMVCRTLTVSGTRMPQRVCATKAEWEDHTKRQAQDLLDGQQESDRRSFIDPKSLPR